MSRSAVNPLFTVVDNKLPFVGAKVAEQQPLGKLVNGFLNFMDGEPSQLEKEVGTVANAAAASTPGDVSRLTRSIMTPSYGPPPSSPPAYVDATKQFGREFARQQRDNVGAVANAGSSAMSGLSQFGRDFGRYEGDNFKSVADTLTTTIRNLKDKANDAAVAASVAPVGLNAMGDGATTAARAGLNAAARESGTAANVATTTARAGLNAAANSEYGVAANAARIGLQGKADDAASFWKTLATPTNRVGEAAKIDGLVTAASQDAVKREAQQMLKSLLQGSLAVGAIGGGLYGLSKLFATKKRQTPLYSRAQYLDIGEEDGVRKRATDPELFADPSSWWGVPGALPAAIATVPLGIGAGALAVSGVNKMLKRKQMEKELAQAKAEYENALAESSTRKLASDLATATDRLYGLIQQKSHTKIAGGQWGDMWNAGLGMALLAALGTGAGGAYFGYNQARKNRKEKTYQRAALERLQQRAVTDPTRIYAVNSTEE